MNALWRFRREHGERFVTVVVVGDPGQIEAQVKPFGEVVVSPAPRS